MKAKMKYAILVGDGMADEPMEELGGKTPLEYAETPNMDALAEQGRTGRVSTVPEGMDPGSDVANMSLLGYDPRTHYTGRAPIEVASLGLPISAQDTAFRCNLVTIEKGVMRDYSAGHIENEDAKELIMGVNKKLATAAIQFYPGVSYRHILIINDFTPLGIRTTPPHDITGQKVKSYLPQGNHSDMLISLLKGARAYLVRSKINKRRKEEGKSPATDIWLWGQGQAGILPSLYERYGLTGSVISAVDLVQGLGKLAGMTARFVEGATGYLGTNYEGKVQSALRALKKEDFVYLHVEAPDETSHEGSLEKKLQAIREFDENVVGPMREGMTKHEKWRILVCPDHPTLISTRTHSATPVPFAVAGIGIERDKVKKYSEKSIPLTEGSLTGMALFDAFIRGTFDGEGQKDESN